MRGGMPLFHTPRLSPKRRESTSSYWTGSRPLIEPAVNPRCDCKSAMERAVAWPSALSGDERDLLTEGVR
jgi:hypothetical protein